MEQKLRKLLSKKSEIEKSKKRVNILLLSTNSNESSRMQLSLYKAFSSCLCSLEQIKSELIRFEKYDKLNINSRISIINPNGLIFESRARHQGESFLSFYSSKLTLKNSSDTICFNLAPEDMPSFIIIVIHEYQENQSLIRLRDCVHEFQGKKIFYPHVVLTQSVSASYKELIIERISIFMNLPRSCCYFIDNYLPGEWQSNLDKDLDLLSIIIESLS